MPSALTLDPTPMHNVPYGLAIWLGGLLLLIVVLVYVKPCWEARRAQPPAPPEPPRDPHADDPS